MSKNSANHLEILSKNEISSLYSPPLWDSPTRLEYFYLSSEIQPELIKLHDHTAVFFILQWGYFRATHQFHPINLDNMQDELTFILKHCIKHNIKLPNLKQPSRPTMLKIKKQILRLFNYSEVDTGKRNSLNELALNLVKIHSKPNIIFKEMLKHIERKRWVLPVYSFMQDLIGSAMSYEQKRLSKGLDRLLSKKQNDTSTNY